MTIIGIDPGVERVGFAILKYEKNAQHLLDYGCIKTSKNLDFPARLNEIANDVKQLVIKHRPDAAALEEVFFSKNVKTAMRVSHARGVIMEILEDFGIPVHELNPSKIKMNLTGYGRATKLQIRKMTQVLLNLKKPIMSDDAADAIASALALKIPNES